MKCVWVMMFLHSALSQLEKFNVKGPDGPVVATAGSDVILPCSVKREDQSSMNAVDMDIKWTRSDLGGALVHFYENHTDSNFGQIAQYRERTVLITTELQNGITSLRLTEVNLFDEGVYKCRVDSKYWDDEVSFDLTVEVVGTRPVITVEKYDENSEELSLLCESEGWRPRPDLQWLDSNRNSLTAGVTESHRDAELFSVTRRLTVSKSDIDTFFCRATLRHHTKEDRITAVALAEHLPRPPIAKIVAGVLVPVVLIIVAFVIFFIYKDIQRKRQWKKVEAEIRSSLEKEKQEKEKQSSNPDVDNLKEEKQSSNPDVDNLKEEIRRVNEEVNNLKKETPRTKALNNLKEENQRLNKEVEELKEGIQTLNGQVDILKKEIRRVNEEVNNLKKGRMGLP